MAAYRPEGPEDLVIPFKGTELRLPGDRPANLVLWLTRIQMQDGDRDVPRGELQEVLNAVLGDQVQEVLGLNPGEEELGLLVNMVIGAYNGLTEDQIIKLLEAGKQGEARRRSRNASLNGGRRSQATSGATTASTSAA